MSSLLTPSLDQTLILLDAARDDLAAATQVPAAWRALWATMIDLLRTALATRTTSDYTALRCLAIRVAAGGRNACWAQARVATDNAIRYQWQAAASIHRRLLQVFITGWPSTLTWRNPALPLEYNNLSTTPARPLTTDLAEAGIATLLLEPTLLDPDEASAAMVSIAGGIFTSGSFEA